MAYYILRLNKRSDLDLLTMVYGKVLTSKANSARAGGPFLKKAIKNENGEPVPLQQIFELALAALADGRRIRVIVPPVKSLPLEDAVITTTKTVLINGREREVRKAHPFGLKGKLEDPASLDVLSIIKSAYKNEFGKQLIRKSIINMPSTPLTMTRGEAETCFRKKIGKMHSNRTRASFEIDGCIKKAMETAEKIYRYDVELYNGLVESEPDSTYIVRNGKLETLGEYRGRKKDGMPKERSIAGPMDGRSLPPEPEEITVPEGPEEPVFNKPEALASYPDDYADDFCDDDGQDDTLASDDEIMETNDLTSDIVDNSNDMSHMDDLARLFS